MVLDKPDNGISLSHDGVNCHKDDHRLTSVDSTQADHLHFLDETHVPLHKTVCCALCSGFLKRYTIDPMLHLIVKVAGCFNSFVAQFQACPLRVHSPVMELPRRRAKTPEPPGHHGYHNRRLPNAPRKKSLVSVSGFGSSSTENLDQILNNLRTRIQEKEEDMSDRMDRALRAKQDLNDVVTGSDRPLRSRSWDCLDEADSELKSIAQTIANFERLAAERNDEEQVRQAKRLPVMNLIQKFEGSPKKKRSLPSIPVAKVSPTRDYQKDHPDTKSIRSGRTWKVKPEREVERETRKQGPKWFLNLTDCKGDWDPSEPIKEKSVKRSSSFKTDQLDIKPVTGRLNIHLTKSMPSIPDAEDLDPNLSVRVERPLPKGILKSREVEVNPWEDLVTSYPAQSSTLPHKKKAKSGMQRSSSMKDVSSNTLPKRRVSFKEQRQIPAQSPVRSTGYRRITSSRFRQLVGEGDEAGLEEQYLHPDFRIAVPDLIAYV
ncbi:hypothetical protein CAPTEDRAFT_214164 [Capitella teleta]|uniref:Uncharacterized protein n=1 Tax=Capitella teleta TaxID=283909 RepID=R7TRU4_CAPTE|nr:hypothetical protein CAPTEDRAFT_214164 [Capitella teleta]|eukprot:ELT94221.1 hypothetical protein CAPTEDRAFT_214164 [Capitella teleta]